MRGAGGRGGSIDLHGLDQNQARFALVDFIFREQATGARAVLFITGKGAMGEGMLRRRTPEWLAQAPLAAIVAGFSPAGRKDGGNGALYVALRRSPR